MTFLHFAASILYKILYCGDVWFFWILILLLLLYLYSISHLSLSLQYQIQYYKKLFITVIRFNKKSSYTVLNTVLGGI